jgi:ParB family chromosome partitioning protein
MAMKKQSTGLGKGFDTLIPRNFDSSLLMDEKDRVQKLFITDILPNKKQPRSTFDEAALKELADSMIQHGILQPIVVRVLNDGKYGIVAGERRWRAAQIAGMEQIPAIVRTMEELEQLEIALVENVQRVDLSPLEQALSIRRLHEQFSIAYDDIAKRLGKAVQTVANIVRLLNLPANAQAALRDGKITEGHGRAILAIKDYPEKQTELLNFIIKNGWSVRQAEQFAIATKKGKATTKAAQKQVANTSPATEKLSKKLEIPVTIKRTARGGKLELGFRTDTQLDSLIRKLGKL